MTQAIEADVARRRVMYLPGYDPIPPRRYRELYRKESAAQAAISGYQISLSPKTGDGPYGWHVDAVMDDTPTSAEVDILVWSDIVRGSMAQGILATYAQMLRTSWIYISTGALRRLMWLRKGPVIAALYPIGMLLVQLAIALVLSSLVARLVLALLGWAFGDTGSIGTALFAGIMIGGTLAVLRYFKQLDNRLFVYYLMHDYAYSARWRGAIPPDLDDRMTQFGDRIAEALTSEVDEVLIVGHSSGAHLAVTILADLIRAGRVPRSGPKLAFLSLGQVVPMVSFLPDAHRLRADLHYLSQRSELTWVDVTAPGDGCAFALCDPVSVSGVAPPDKLWPLVFSAAFTQTLSPARWKALRWRFFRLHFQYLCAFDQPKDYDYFQITAGPISLSRRYQDRPPSRSRIDAPASKFTSMAA